MDPLVTFILSEPGMVDRLLAQHADDGTGHCRVCSGGAQTGRYVYPCTIHHHATPARDVAGSRGKDRLRST